MKLKFKEDPKEWRKSALLAALGLAILSTLLRWRRHLPADYWCALLALLGGVGDLRAAAHRAGFRGWKYRLSLRLGFYSSQFMGWCVLAGLVYLHRDAGRIRAASGRARIRCEAQNVRATRRLTGIRRGSAIRWTGFFEQGRLCSVAVLPKSGTGRQAFRCRIFVSGG